MAHGDRVRIGERFGRWTVVRHAPPKKGRAACLVRCVCGAEVVHQERRLKMGSAQGCGGKACYWRCATADAVEASLMTSVRGVLDAYRDGGAEALEERDAEGGER